MLNVRLSHALVGSCGVKITIKARQRGQFLRRRLFAEIDKVIPLHSEAMIPLLLVPLPNNRNFLFHPIAQINLTLFVHIMYHDTIKILVKNTSDRPLHKLCCQRLGHIVDVCYNNCFLVNAKSALNSATVLSQTAPFFEYELSCTPIPTNPSMKTSLDNKVRVYGDKHAVTLLS